MNLGFVLNVIEDPDERRETLKAAFALARKVLIVSVMLGYQSKREQFAAYEDRIRTQRNTFQRYYVQDEFRSYVEKTLGANAIPIAAGICLVQGRHGRAAVPLARQQVRREWRLLRREPDSEAVASLIEEHREQIDTYWLRALELGRPAAPEECPEAQSLIRLVGSWRRVHEWVGRFFSPDEYEAAAIGRQKDLLVYFASATSAGDGRTANFPTGSSGMCSSSSATSPRRGMRGSGPCSRQGTVPDWKKPPSSATTSLARGSERGPRLDVPPVGSWRVLPLIRIYVGCALQLFGDAGSVDLIKAHLQSGKVTFLVYDDFEGADTPKLIERIKVDLPRLRVDFFDYVGEYEPQPLSDDPKDFYQR